jgi:hypothetical protein
VNQRRSRVGISFGPDEGRGEFFSYEHNHQAWSTVGDDRGRRPPPSSWISPLIKRRGRSATNPPAWTEASAAGSACLPTSLQALTTGYREESNPLMDWAESECEIDPVASEMNKTLRDSYERYC